MGNPFASEVALVIDGQRRVLKLTLGALAELEAGLQTDTLVELVQRFEAGGFSTRDVMKLIVAGLRGGGWEGRASDLLNADIEGGPMQAAKAAALLLARAFVLPDEGADAAV
ncbi:gene transfer agent family protein [Lentibacter algarum]|uniref:gene transfer agent family protein n=1 Tax=Lentibacter algarum TaxID=576131 RepID=UPI001C08EFB1|nr:gene transfer agent family protein [Lentibacter algarum]MBU2982733.1 gene transfer agent family protein [Lentibacter algarum]